MQRRMFLMVLGGALASPAVGFAQDIPSEEMIMRRLDAVKPAVSTTAPAPTAMPAWLTSTSRPLLDKVPNNCEGTLVTTRLITVLPVLGWSREVGDLRVAHFIATHALHFVPLVGWLVAGRLPDPAARGAVILAALAWVALTFATFAQALMGNPVI